MLCWLPWLYLAGISIGDFAEVLADIWMAETKAGTDFDFFVKAYGVKHPAAANCRTKNCSDLLAFYDFPVEHWKHIRTSNPIERIFATVRH